MRELLEEKDEGLAAFKEMEAAALRLQEDIIKRCAERDTLLERNYYACGINRPF